MAIEVGTGPFRHRSGDAPSAGEIVLAVAARHHGVSILADKRDQHAVGAAVRTKPRTCPGLVMERKSGSGSCGGPPLDGVGSGLVGRNLLEHGIGIAVLRQPLLRRSAVRREMHKLGMVAGAVEYANRSHSRSLDDGEAQAGGEREGPMHADGDDAAGAIVGLVQREARMRVDETGAKRPCLRIRRPWLLLVFQASSFRRCRSGGRGVPSDQATMEPRGACSKIVCADMLSSILGEAENQTAAGRTRRRQSDRKRGAVIPRRRGSLPRARHRRRSRGAAPPGHRHRVRPARPACSSSSSS